MIVNWNAIRRIGAVALAVATPMAVATGVHAQTVTDEVRCVLLSNALASGAKNAQGRQVGASVGSYFMGRLDARQPAQVKAAIAAQKKSMPASAAANAMNACAARASRAETRLRDLAR